MKSSLLKKLIIATFLSVPAVSSVISTIHLVDLFNLGNPTWLSILLAVTFELGSIASLLAISVIERIKVGAIWFIFFILSGLQIIGNVYYSYSFTSDQLLANPTFLSNFMDLFSFITGEEIRDVKIFLSCIIGIPIPLIALFFLKSNIDYLKPTNKEEQGEVNSKADSLKDLSAQTSNSLDVHTENAEHKLDELTSLSQDLAMYDQQYDESISIEQPSTNESESDKEPLNTEIIESESTHVEQSEPVHFDRVKIRRNHRPMISERRSDSMSALYRG